jgi:hypothetical protein
MRSSTTNEKRKLLGNMLPFEAIHNIGNMGSSYAVLLAESIYANCSFGIQLTYLAHTLSRKFAIPPLLALTKASLTKAILHVVGSCSKEKMLRINAERYIALMANLNPFRNRPEMKFPRKAMGPLSMWRAMPRTELTIAIFQACTRPKPAALRFSSMFQEHLLRRHTPCSCAAQITAKLSKCIAFGSELFSAVSTDRKVVIHA